MMGVGKSTVGAQLAMRLGRPFVDTDQEVERVAGRTIAEIFESDGEARFRALEAEAIRAAAANAAVVALGGGAVAEPGAMQRLLASGEVVYLMADPDVLIGRIGDPSSRPLLAGLDRKDQILKLEVLLAKRKPFYEQAGIRIDARGTTEEVVERIVDELAARTE
jgi:shikimate kinase